MNKYFHLLYGVLVASLLAVAFRNLLRGVYIWVPLSTCFVAFQIGLIWRTAVLMNRKDWKGVAVLNFTMSLIASLGIGIYLLLILDVYSGNWHPVTILGGLLVLGGFGLYTVRASLQLRKADGPPKGWTWYIPPKN